MVEILLVVFGAVGVGFLLIFLLALSERKRGPKGDLRGEERRLSPSQFEKACLLVVEGMKLEIDEVTRTGDSQLDILARNPTPITGGGFLVHCLYLDPEEVIGASQIIELSNMVLQERLSKGIFITTGRFTEEIPTIGELAPIEFIDGEVFRGLLLKYAPDYRAILS